MSSREPGARVRALVLWACAGLLACGGSGGGSGSGSSNATTSRNPASTTVAGDNVLRVSVNGSTCDAATSSSYRDKPCVAVTICAPGTGTCQTVDDVLLDTGSFGLRLYQGSISGLGLTPLAAGASGRLEECAYFADGTVLWGPVATAEVALGGEAAVTVPIQLWGSTDANPCETADVTSQGFAVEPLPSGTGFHGVLGIGPARYDCGPTCASSATSASGYRYYFACTGSGASTSCTATTATLAEQVMNPVAAQATDANGFILQLPAVPSDGAETATGNLILGIGTRDNNADGASTTLALQDDFYFRATASSGSRTWAFADTGSNGLFLPSGLAGGADACSSDTSSTWHDWYCPTSTESLQATFTDGSGGSASVTYSLASARALMAGGYAVFSDLGGPTTGEADFGLPFHLGRTIYVWLPTTAAGGDAALGF